MLGGLKVFLSLSTSALGCEAVPVVDTLWVYRASVLPSRLGCLGLLVGVNIVQDTGADGVARFRFSDRRISDVDI